MISQAIDKHLSPTDSDKLSSESDSSAQRRMYKMLLAGMGAVLVGMALIAASKEIQYVAEAGLLLTLLGAFLALYAVISPYLPKKGSGARRSQKSALPQAESTNKLTRGSEPELPLSIAENTTRTLEPSLRHKPNLSEEDR
jgi:hypothetical protein